MKVISKVYLLGIVSLFLSCVSQKKYHQLQANYDKSLEIVVDKERTIIGQKSELRSLRDKVHSLEETLKSCLKMNQSGSVNISKLIDEINSSNKYIKQLIASNSRKDSLNQALSSKLKRSLDDVDDQDVNVSVKKGVVFISLSDKMLYKSGSYIINPKAKGVLEKVARVINDYKDYDVLIEGHTDNVPISKKGIKDNWDLSALRSTAVVRYFQENFGVDPSRMTAGARSEYEPKATNNTTNGRSINRRTEVIILPKLDEFLKLLDKAPSVN